MTADGQSRSRPATHPVFAERADLTVVLLGIDSRMRGLAEILEEHRMRPGAQTWEPPSEALTAITQKLFELRAGWVLSGAYNSPRTDPEIAESTYLGIVRNLFERATRVSSADGPRLTGGVYRDGARASRAVFVVCLIVAANETLMDVSRGADAGQIITLLFTLQKLGDTRLAALLVSPEPNVEPWDIDLARRRFPELRFVDEQTLEPRTRCVGCGAPVLKPFGACQVCHRKLTET